MVIIVQNIDLEEPHSSPHQAIYTKDGFPFKHQKDQKMRMDGSMKNKKFMISAQMLELGTPNSTKKKTRSKF